MKDKLIILGSGGGRHHIRTQHRATGGFLYRFADTQAHIDPGPGAIVRLNQFKANPLDTELFIVTHVHLDHFSDLCAVIESSREHLHDKDHNYYQIGTLLSTPDALPLISNYHKAMLEKIVPFQSGDTYTFKGIKIVGTQVQHSTVQGFGLKFYLYDYVFAYTSDTTVFPGFSKQYNDVDIMVLNLLRPDSVTCSRHLCTDQVIPYLNQITPSLKALVITHFGSFMDGPFSEKNHVPSQLAKLKNQTNIKHIVAAQDGLNISIQELLS